MLSWGREREESIFTTGGSVRRPALSSSPTTERYSEIWMMRRIILTIMMTKLNLFFFYFFYWIKLEDQLFIFWEEHPRVLRIQQTPEIFGKNGSELKNCFWKIENINWSSFYTFPPSHHQSLPPPLVGQFSSPFHHLILLGQYQRRSTNCKWPKILHYRYL